MWSQTVGLTEHLSPDCPVLPEPLIEEAVFSPLYILASFVKDTVLIGAWVCRFSTLESVKYINVTL